MSPLDFLFKTINMINAITPIHLEWNAWNGFIFKVLDIELGKYDSRSLFSINVSNNFLIIDILFFQITVFDKTNKY